eukprot:TRINITY_DN1416_c2_g1_i1.p1 TRINITY_DN1416_c2_g1~~TRINITY_DN1416_c2_g1_i1.p1  ORF type:complete len:513 (-),score=90.84 TRINITY_DN1416_c2_g1_i1:46-1539(-)
MIYKSVHKATNFKAKPPKEKHVQAVLTFTYNSRSSEEIIRSMGVRKDKSNWAVVLKVLILMHRCFKDGDDQFIDLLTNRSTDIFALNYFKRSAPPNHVITVFISKYARYLEEKVSVYKMVHYQFEKTPDCLKEFSNMAETLRVVSKLQSQLNALCNCKLRVRISDLRLVKFAYRYLLKDSFDLYAKLNEVLLELSELFWDMNKSDATKVIAIYKLFIKETSALSNMYNNANMMFSNLPKLKEIDSSIITTMEEYVNGLGEDDGNYADNDDSAEDLVDQDNLKTSNQFDARLTGYGFDEGDDSDVSDSSSGDDEPQNDDFLSLIMGGLGVSSQNFFQPPPSFQKNNNTSSFFNPSTPPPTHSTYQHKADFIRNVFDFKVSAPTDTTVTNVTDPLGLFDLNKSNTPSQSPNIQQVVANPFDDSVNPFSNRVISQSSSTPQQTVTNVPSNPFLSGGNGSSNGSVGNQPSNQQQQFNPFLVGQQSSTPPPQNQQINNPFLL